MMSLLYDHRSVVQKRQSRTAAKANSEKIKANRKAKEKKNEYDDITFDWCATSQSSTGKRKTIQEKNQQLRRNNKYNLSSGLAGGWPSRLSCSVGLRASRTTDTRTRVGLIYGLLSAIQAGGALPLGGDGGPRPDDVYTSLRHYCRRRLETMDSNTLCARPNAARLLRVLII